MKRRGPCDEVCGWWERKPTFCENLWIWGAVIFFLWIFIEVVFS